MNKFAAVGLYVEAAANKRVIVITDSASHIPDEMHEFDHLTDSDSCASVRRTAGNARIVLKSGGSIRFLSRRGRDSLRGLSADIVYVDGDIDMELHRALLPMVAASRFGEIVRA